MIAAIHRDTAYERLPGAASERATQQCARLPMVGPEHSATGGSGSSQTKVPCDGVAGRFSAIAGPQPSSGGGTVLRPDGDASHLEGELVAHYHDGRRVPGRRASIRPTKSSTWAV